MKSLLILSLSIGSTLSLAQAETSIENAEVTIPYSELKALLDTIHRAETETVEPEPPVTTALESARYTLDFSGDQPELTAAFEARGFTDDWHVIPLFGGDPRLASSNENPTDGIKNSIVWRENHFALLKQTWRRR